MSIKIASSEELEKDKDVYYIKPIEGYCTKFKEYHFDEGTITVEGMIMKRQENMKFFINICHCVEIPPPLDDYTEDLLSEKLDTGMEDVKIPMSVSEVHLCHTNKNEEALKVDVLINSNFYGNRVAESLFIRQFIVIVACDLINAKHKITLDPSESIELRNKKHIGELMIQKVRKTPAEAGIKEIKDEKIVLLDDEKDDEGNKVNFAEFEKIIHGKEDLPNVNMFINQVTRELKINITVEENVEKEEDIMVKMNSDRIVVIVHKKSKVAEMYSRFLMNYKLAKLKFDNASKLLSISVPSTRSIPIFGEYFNPNQEDDFMESSDTNYEFLKDINSQRAIHTIINKSLNERLVLLVCDRVCHEEREEIPKIIREFSKDFGIKKTNSIHFHFLLKKEKIPQYNIEKFVGNSSISLLFFIGEKAYPFRGQLNSKKDIYHFLLEREHVNMTKLKTYEDLDKFLSSINNDMDQKFYVLYLNFKKHKKCGAYGINSFENSVKSVDLKDITPIKMEVEQTKEILVIIEMRLSQIKYKKCPTLIIIHKGKYKEIPLIFSPRIIRKFIEYIEENYYEIEDTWTKIGEPITYIQLQYLVDEHNINDLQYNGKFVTAAVIGGFAILLLGFSIFWALNGA
ncbi:PIH1 family-containing protein [Strongyloides ratti]|uniref:PIH1 family-containing protein n=1 Tax=Strongyloides ratti TaxID=34506 RepID=A0A090L2J8_STRRB|nr:PIH1 family-containing protein [Strongyloides ratti]CEF62322.1 PIH1 family-containing protein [Strongyloides ratti]